MYGSFAKMYGSFAKMYGSCAKMYGSFAQMYGSLSEHGALSRHNGPNDAHWMEDGALLRNIPSKNVFRRESP